MPWDYNSVMETFYYTSVKLKGKHVHTHYRYYVHFQEPCQNWSHEKKNTRQLERKLLHQLLPLLIPWGRCMIKTKSIICKSLLKSWLDFLPCHLCEPYREWVVRDLLRSKTLPKVATWFRIRSKTLNCLIQEQTTSYFAYASANKIGYDETENSPCGFLYIILATFIIRGHRLPLKSIAKFPLTSVDVNQALILCFSVFLRFKHLIK